MARHVYSCPVRWSDMDAYGHVNNARFLTLLEEARIDLLCTCAAEQGLDWLEAGVLVKYQEIEYLRPVQFRDPLRIELWVCDVRPASFRIGYEAFVGGAPVATASTTVVAYDLAGGSVRRIAPAEREFLLRFQDGAKR